MARIEFVTVQGESLTVDAKSGLSLMETAVQNGIEGITAECGGACACATCHVYLDDETAGRVTPLEEYEADLLESLEHVRAGSRLSCQIVVSDALDGSRIEVAEAG